MKVLGLLSLCIGACLAATAVEVLDADSEFSTLVSLVKQAGLVDVLNAGTFTIFAPTNRAFNNTPASVLSSLAKDPTGALADLLKYHVVQGKIPSSAATNELQITSLTGEKIRFNTYSHNHAVTVEGSQIINFDKAADNGVIHVIDTVMMPPTGDIVDIVANTDEVRTLLSLVQQAGIADALKADGLTVFAPVNSAFSRLSQKAINRITSSKTLLTEILEYHVVPHTEYSKGLYNREFLRTLDRNHDIMQIHASSSQVRINSNGHVIKADIPAKNGVVHLIDNVLIPLRYRLSILIGK